MPSMTFTPEDLKAANPKAVMVRVEVKNSRQYSGQRSHDLRIGPQPNYVDVERADFNRVVIEPPRAKALKDACKGRRDARDVKRAMKSNAGIAAVGIVGFGSEAKKTFDLLSTEAQDAAFLAVGHAVAEEANTRLVGLVVHLDESSIHAHLTFEGYDMDGRPLSETMKRGMCRRFQDRAAEVMAVHAPGIERGRSRATRRQNGATYSETMHASVAELHERLPHEIAAAQSRLDALAASVKKNENYIKAIVAKAEMTAKEAKRLETYKARLERQMAEHLDARAQLEDLKSVFAREAAALEIKSKSLDAVEGELDAREKALDESEASLVEREADVRRREGALDTLARAIHDRLGEIADKLGVGRGLRQIISAIDQYRSELKEPPQESGPGLGM